METIFDHNPTEAEILALTDGMTKEAYLSDWMFSKEHSFLDIALLYDSRQNLDMSKKYQSLAPELYQQWQWGLDDVAIVQ